MQQVAYLNNYALLLSTLGCHSKATALVTSAITLAPQDANLLDSQRQIIQAQQRIAESSSCID